MRIASIERPGALYGAATSARTFEDVGRSIWNPRDFEEAVGAHLTKATGNLK